MAEDGGMSAGVGTDNLQDKGRRKCTSPARWRSLLALTFVPCLFAFLSACGNQDYQKPLDQFQEASAKVIRCTQNFLDNMNRIEQEAAIARLMFDKQPVDLPGINRIQVITPHEIEVRTKALEALSSYTANLAELIQSKHGENISGKTQELGQTLSAMATDSQSLPPSAAGVENARLGAATLAAATAVSLVAQALVERKQRHAVEQAIRENDAPISDLTKVIEDDMEAAYARQQATLSEMEVELVADYKRELAKEKQAKTAGADPGGADPGGADPVLILLLSERLNQNRARQATLKAADPKPAIAAMRKAHCDLVKYVTQRNPVDLAELAESAEDFWNRAQPLAEAVAALVNSN